MLIIEKGKATEAVYLMNRNGIGKEELRKK